MMVKIIGMPCEPFLKCLLWRKLLSDMRYKVKFRVCFTIISVISIFAATLAGYDVCGKDNSPITAVYEGMADIHTYPWLGVLVYPKTTRRLLTQGFGDVEMTAVILITRELVIGAATNIDHLPKDNFRQRSRVILGHNCSGPMIRVLTYNFHPEYKRHTFSAIVLIQLDVTGVKQKLHPICPPRVPQNTTRFYAVAVPDDCDKQLNIFEMEYVNPEECRTFYRKTNLDISSMWPTHVACARAYTNDEDCVWPNGVALMARDGNRWSLAGFGVNGPGCNAPARFLDYGMYYRWVQNSILRIGRPAVTRLSQNHVILRRTLSTVQRYGPCDLEEINEEIYTDHVDIDADSRGESTTYNLTLWANVEYSCVIFRVSPISRRAPKPIIHLRRWCLSKQKTCYDFGLLQIDFYVEIFFRSHVIFEVKAYGREARIVDFKRLLAYEHTKLQYPTRWTRKKKPKPDNSSTTPPP